MKLRCSRVAACNFDAWSFGTSGALARGLHAKKGDIYPCRCHMPAWLCLQAHQ